MVFHRLEIRSKATNVAKSIEKVSRQPRLSAEGKFDLGTFVVVSPDGDSETGRSEANIIFSLVEKCINVFFFFFYIRNRWRQ